MGWGGFGDPNNDGISSARAHDGYLYVGTSNGATGLEVWRYDGLDWEQANFDGFGDANNHCAYSLADYDYDLYAGTANETTGGEVWRLPGLTVFADSFESGDTSAWSHTVP